ncbi:MAG: PDZ domain-containing protein, partial [Bryobacteraceae bacterium]
RLNLWWLEIEKGAPVKADTDIYDGPRRIREISWSPDSRWITYTRQLDNTLRAVFAYSLENGQRIQITDGMSDASSPVFDRNGEHLYFAASTDVGLSIAWRDMSAMNRPVTRSVYVTVLRKDLPSPIAPESDEEKPGEAPKPDAPKADAPKTDEAKPAAPPKPPEKTPNVRIDPDGIEQRILALPIPARNYSRLMAGKAGTIFIVEAAQDASRPQTLHKWDMKTRKLDKIHEGFNNLEISHNGEKLLYRQGERYAIVPATAPVRPADGTLRLDGMEVRVDPKVEWRQMFQESWRIQRDFFYDPGLHGLDLPATMKKYEPFLEHVASRSDLTHLFSDMMGELTASHLNVGGGAAPEVKRVQGGLLGADYTIENGRYRVARVFTGESWNPQLRAPLTQPGVNVAGGEYILAVNGREVRDTDNIHSFFEATANKSVKLSVGADPSGAGAREVTVVPVANEFQLRHLAWVEENRRKVDKMSGGRLAYVHLPDTAFGGYTSFNRYYFAQIGKLGAVIDERHNGGGLMADYIVDYLRRPLMDYRVTRDGRDYTTPHGAIFGPKVMLINEYAGSGGDAMPFLFRKAKVGPLIGKRTWGGLVGGLGGWPPLMDGGVVTPPSVGFYNPDTTDWEIENYGVAPDIEVELDPKAWREGRDLQLEKGVQVLMEELKTYKPPVPRRPAFPNYHKRSN